MLLLRGGIKVSRGKLLITLMAAMCAVELGITAVDELVTAEDVAVVVVAVEGVTVGDVAAVK